MSYVPPAPDITTADGVRAAREALAGLALSIASDASASKDAALERKALRVAARAAGVHPVALKAATGSPAIVAARPGSN